jgi:hypothetical protein
MLYETIFQLLSMLNLSKAGSEFLNFACGKLNEQKSDISRFCPFILKQYGVYLAGVAVHAEIVTADEIGNLASFWILAPVNKVNMNFILVYVYILALIFDKKTKRGQSTVKNVSQQLIFKRIRAIDVFLAFYIISRTEIPYISFKK